MQVATSGLCVCVHVRIHSRLVRLFGCIIRNAFVFCVSGSYAIVRCLFGSLMLRSGRIRAYIQRPHAGSYIGRVCVRVRVCVCMCTCEYTRGWCASLAALFEMLSYFVLVVHMRLYGVYLAL